MRIGIIGRLAEQEALFDGQTIKTRVIKQELEKAFPEAEIACVETYNIKKRLPLILFETNRLLRNCDCIFVLLSHNGRKVFFPLLYVINKLYKRPIYHDAIGGRLAKEVEESRKWKKYVCSFKKNWVELPSLENKLRSLGVDNAEVLPNFKRLTRVQEEELDMSIPDIFRFCTFSRVIESKGITTAANAVRFVNEKAGRKVAELHVYGEIDSSYKADFEHILKEQPEEVYYEGSVSFDKSVEAIKGYFALLFPTVHYGEGFPGTIIDAYDAGLPVIASDWNYNKEIIKENITGVCYPYDKPEQFNNLIWKYINEPQLLIDMKKNCLWEADVYSPDTVMKKVKKQIIEDVFARKES